MTRYAWIIDRDHFTRFPASLVAPDESGTVGPRDARADLVAQLMRGAGTPFRMHDDDGELTYAGRLVTVDDADPAEYADAPLDDFGEPHAGCTRIRYLSVPLCPFFRRSIRPFHRRRVRPR